MLAILVVLSICALGTNAATCTMYYDVKNPGVLTRKFGSNRVIIIPSDGRLTFDDNVIIEGYCAGGFQEYTYSGGTTAYKELNFLCDGNTVKYQVPGSTTSSQFSNTGSLKCSKASLYYEANMTTCDSYGMQFGFLIDETPVILENICYDLNTMRTRFIHYVIGTRTTVIENQEQFNPGNATISSIDPVEMTFDVNAIKKENASIMAAVNEEMPNYAEIVQYQLEPLIPFDIAAGFLQSYATHVDTTSMAAWWKPLKFGNWREVENAMRNIALDGTYDVFSGTSGALTYPFNGNCFLNEHLTYKVDEYIRTVPLYMWTYVKERGSDEEGVAIVGVNSPFLEAMTNSAEEFCDDQCDKFEWLSTVNRVRHMNSLGFIICCKPDDVQDKLDGFPIL